MRGGSRQPVQKEETLEGKDGSRSQSPDLTQQVPKWQDQGEPGSSFPHSFPKFAQIYVHGIGDAI